jgi:hypothetical protein
MPLKVRKARTQEISPDIPMTMYDGDLLTVTANVDILVRDLLVDREMAIAEAVRSFEEMTRKILANTTLVKR